MKRTAIVTGGSRGIGKAICLKLAEQQWNVVVNYYGEENAVYGEDVAKACEALGGKGIAVDGDVSQKAAAENLVEVALEKYGSIDILVNNAGITKDNLMLRMTEEEFSAVIDTNLKGAFLCSKGVVRAMMKQRYGRIINISSVVGLSGNSGQVNYSASKAGLIGMTKSMAKELASRNITVNAVAPGWIETDMTASLSEEIQEVMRNAIPMRRIGAPEDVANAVLFFAADSAAYITGQVLCVDGGMAM